MSLFAQIKMDIEDLAEHKKTLLKALDEYVTKSLEIKERRGTIKRALQIDDDDELNHMAKRECACQATDAAIAAAVDADDFTLTWRWVDDVSAVCLRCNNETRGYYVHIEDDEEIYCKACVTIFGSVPPPPRDVLETERIDRIAAALEVEVDEFGDESLEDEAERAKDRKEWRYFSLQDIGVCCEDGCGKSAQYHLRGSSEYQYCPEHFPFKVKF
jgi:hypothetical protein